MHRLVRDISCKQNIYRYTSESRARLVLLNMFKPSKAVLLLWIIFVIFISRLSLLYCLVCYLQLCDHLLVKSLPIGSIVHDVYLTVFYRLSGQVRYLIVTVLIFAFSFTFIKIKQKVNEYD